MTTASEPPTPPPSSSPARPLPAQGLIVRHGRVTGPVQLPDEDIEAFIEDFNQRYADHGIRIVRPPTTL